MNLDQPSSKSVLLLVVITIKKPKQIQLFTLSPTLLNTFLQQFIAHYSPPHSLQQRIKFLALSLAVKRFHYPLLATKFYPCLSVSYSGWPWTSPTHSPSLLLLLLIRWLMARSCCSLVVSQIVASRSTAIECGRVLWTREILLFPNPDFPSTPPLHFTLIHIIDASGGL